MLNKSVAETFKEIDVPFFALYGDGSEIETSALEEIDSLYKETKVSFTWQKGDVLLLDNLLIAHGRNSYKGEREILVAMFKDI